MGLRWLEKLPKATSSHYLVWLLLFVGTAAQGLAGEVHELPFGPSPLKPHSKGLCLQ